MDRGVYTALGIGCVYSVASFLILRFTDKLLIGLFLEAKETAIMANAQSFIFWNSVFYIPLAVLIIYRYTIQGLGYSSLAMFAGVGEMIARAMVGVWFVPLLLPDPGLSGGAPEAAAQKRPGGCWDPGTSITDPSYERDSCGCPAFYLQIPPKGLYYK